MYYGYVNNSKIIESLPIDEVIMLPEECQKITDIKNIFNIIHDIFSDNCVTKDSYLLQLNLAETHPKFKMNKIFDNDLISYENLSDKVWVANYVIVNKIYPLKYLSTFIDLIDLGADYNSTKLFDWACYNNFLDLVKYLHSCDVKPIIEIGCANGLYLASVNNHCEMVTYLLENNNYFNFGIEYVHYYLCSRNNIEMINIIHNYYISNNILPDHELLKITSSLFWACMCGYTDLGINIINFMKRYDEDFNIDYSSLLEYTCCGGSIILLKEILKIFNPNQKNLNRCLIFAIEYSQIDIIHYLIDLGASLNDSNEYIQNVCSSHGNIMGTGNKYQTFKFLIDNGVDITYNNNAAISLAVQHKNFDIVKLLLDKGVDPSCHDNYVLKYAVYHDNIEIVKKLIQMEVDPFPLQDFLLNICSQQNCFTTLKYLLELGLEVKDQTIIYRTIERNHKDCFKILIQNINYLDYDEILKLCIKYNCLQFIIILFKIYHDIIVTEEILIFAYQDKSFDILEFLLNRPIHYDSLELIICQAVLKNQLSLSQDLISCNNLMNNLHLLHFIINKGDTELIKYLMENNYDKNYNSWALIFSLKNYEITQFLLENFKFDKDDITYAKTCAKILEKWSVYKLLQLYCTNYIIELPSSKLQEYLNVYGAYEYNSGFGKYEKKLSKLQFEKITLDSKPYEKN
ncbi:ankyrin repeat protein [Acanthamoeba polyphaga moumouvirus]|uniref:Ankyrin repeat protein n=1 Tax=Acanthamoeba polyphaga moumouvirus TaxID=1269028 RepID=L7RB64_9VIRU|nr:ankyrin repeat protein [Acanthamoeba polyphaga moumouvirus]AGC01669.1 ankyrin repeat protein [Acanthamoeba polyphaga moumouvirus]